MRAFGWPGIDPPVLRFSASELTRSEGKAKTPAKSIRRVASQGPCRMRLGRRPKMRAPWRKRTELLEDRLARASHGQGCGRLPRRASGTPRRAGGFAGGGFCRHGRVGGLAEERSEEHTFELQSH